MISLLIMSTLRQYPLSCSGNAYCYRNLRKSETADSSKAFKGKVLLRN